MNSEFPQTKLSKVVSKIGWIFSPLLLITLIVVTLFTAEKIKFDFKTGSIKREGSIEIKDSKESFIYIDDKERGKTPGIYDVEVKIQTTQLNDKDVNNKDNSVEINEEQIVNVKLTKDGRRDWIKEIKPKVGLVRVLRPMMYPNVMDFGDGEIKATNVYVKDYANTFFYEKVEDNKINLYRYDIDKQVFGIRVRNELFADITRQVQNIFTTPDTQNIELKEYSIIPSNSSKKVLLVIPNEKLVIISDTGEVVTVPNLIPKKEDTFTWNPGDSYIVQKSGQDIYSIEVSTNKLLFLYRPQSNDEKTSIQFLLDSVVVIKVDGENFTDLIQNNYQGNDIQKIEIPNFDGIRKNNLVKTYDMLSKQDLILIQTKENIYSYNVITTELKKFNRFEGEEIVFIDSEKEKVLTINSAKLNEFRYIDLDLNESKSFRINDVSPNTRPEKVLGFNSSENIILTYKDRLILSDIDGANQLKIDTFKKPELVLSTKLDNNVYLLIKDDIEGAPTLTIKPNSTPTPKSTTEPTSTPSQTPSKTPTPTTQSTPTITNSPSLTPSASPTLLPTTTPVLPSLFPKKDEKDYSRFILRLEKFEN